MKNQDYNNHLRYYAPHHFIWYPLILVLFSGSLYQAYHNPDKQLEWLAFSIVFLLLGWLSFMMRQHYALTLQNRVVRLEMRLRYYQLTGVPLGALENQLSFGQLAALRFASNEEMPALLQKTLDEQLSPKEIKQSIHHWQGDYMRV